MDPAFLGNGNVFAEAAGSIGTGLLSLALHAGGGEQHSRGLQDSAALLPPGAQESAHRRQRLVLPLALHHHCCALYA